LGKSVHLNGPDKQQISGCGLPPIAVTKVKNMNVEIKHAADLKHLMVSA